MKRMDDEKGKKVALCQQKHEKNHVLCLHEQMHMKYRYCLHEVDANSIVYTNKSNSTFYENYKEIIKLGMGKAKYK
jgi:hypothetical protein